MKFAILLCLLATPALASEPLPPPVKAAPCPAAQAAPVVIVVRPLTLLERARERRAAWHADQLARIQERQSRSVFGFGVFLRVGGVCR